MLLKIKNFVLAHLIQSSVIAVIVVMGIGGASYYSFQKDSPSDNTNESSSNNKTDSCIDLVKVEKILVEKDPAGDPEAWLRFDYTTTATLNCQYTITFYDNQEEVVRMIANAEDTFKSPGGQIHNGYSSTPYQAGMTAKVTIQ